VRSQSNRRITPPAPLASAVDSRGILMAIARGRGASSVVAARSACATMGQAPPPLRQVQMSIAVHTQTDVAKSAAFLSDSPSRKDCASRNPGPSRALRHRSRAGARSATVEIAAIVDSIGGDWRKTTRPRMVSTGERSPRQGRGQREIAYRASRSAST
jgi:hypothetical protein